MQGLERPRQEATTDEPRGKRFGAHALQWSEKSGKTPAGLLLGDYRNRAPRRRLTG